MNCVVKNALAMNIKSLFTITYKDGTKENWEGFGGDDLRRKGKGDIAKYHGGIAKVVDEDGVEVRVPNAETITNAYDELTIKKDGKFWRIYQGSNDAAKRVFDTPESAKKYIKEKWGDGFKIRVKNSVASNAVARNAQDKVLEASEKYFGLEGRRKIIELINERIRGLKTYENILKSADSSTTLMDVKEELKDVRDAISRLVKAQTDIQ